MDNNIVLTEEDFYKKYHPIPNPYDSNASFDGCMFETHGRELDYVKNIPQGRVWSIIDNNDGWYGIVAGYHWINRLGHLITEEEWSDYNEEYVISNEGPVNDWFFSLTIKEQKSVFPDLKIDPDKDEEDQLTDAWYDQGIDEKEVIMNNYIKN